MVSASAVLVASQTGSTGTINIGAAAGGAAVAPGTLATPTVALGTGGALVFNHTSGGYTFSPAISGTGAVSQMGPGTTILTADSGAFAGTTSVTNGILRVDGTLGGPVSVASGATLGGAGTVGGDVAISDGGILGPSAAGDISTLTIGGGLSLSPNSVLDYNFGAVDVVNGSLNDLTVVHGALTLDGTLNVTEAPGGSFEPGIYRVISYDGALTDNGLALGIMPPGSIEVVQTSVPGQVNLVVTAPEMPALNFWDGAAGPHGDGVVNGGNGTWQSGAGNTNWTDYSGAPVAVWADGGFAVFIGAPGTVTVDDSLGAVTASGMQFAVDGYLVQGDDITLIGPSAIVRVGDGSPLGRRTRTSAGYVATIAARLTGDARLVKRDNGTLVLTAANTYTGGTAIEGGTLRVSADNNLGAAAGALGFNAGTLNTTATFSSARATTIEAGGGVFDVDPATTLTMTGVIDGPGMLTKAGGGVLVPSNANSYSGGTAINGGTIRATADANLGAASGPLSFDGGTLNAAASFATSRATTLNMGGGTIATDAGATLTMTGAIGGVGPLAKIGDGTLTMTGANSYSGDTLVAAGTLRAGAANTFSPNSAMTMASAARLDLAGFNQTVARLTNDGLIIMGIGTPPGTLLTVTGDYVDPGGMIMMNTYLGGDGSPSDRLIIGGTATGTTGLLIANAGGPGGPTASNGIEVVHMTNGGASAGAFTLAGRVIEGPFEYQLFHGSVDTSGPENWYLRSTIDCTLDPGSAPCQIVTPPETIRPDYRAEASLYAALPAMQLLYDRTLLDTLHERVGDEASGTARQGGRLGPSRVWGRLILTGGTQGDLAQGIYGAGPRYNYDMLAVQMGADLLRGSRDHVGIYGAWGKMNANVRHWDASNAGRDKLRNWTAGGYWTHFGDGGWYTDLVAQYSWSDFTAHTVGLDTVDILLRRLGIAPRSRAATIDANGDLVTKGHDISVSFETGKAFALGPHYSVEPQAQIVWQKGAIDAFVDPGADIHFNRIETLEGRFGARLLRKWALDPNAPDRLTTLWIRPSVRYTFRGTPEASFAYAGGDIPVQSNLKGASLDLTAGVDGQITRNLTVFASGIYLRRFQGLGESYGAKAGLRIAW